MRLAKDQTELKNRNDSMQGEVAALKALEVGYSRD